MSTIGMLVQNSYSTEEIIDKFNTEEDKDVEWVTLEFTLRQIKTLQNNINMKIGE